MHYLKNLDTSGKKYTVSHVNVNGLSTWITVPTKAKTLMSPTTVKQFGEYCCINFKFNKNVLQKHNRRTYVSGQ